MKKAFLLFMAFSTMALSAQNVGSEKQQNRKEMKSDYTPEQRTELRVKQMTLELNLDDSQQKKVTRIFLGMEKDRPAMAKKRTEMSSDEKFALKTSMLDRRIALKKELKNILSEEQFQKWEESNMKKQHHVRKKRGHSQKRKNR